MFLHSLSATRSSRFGTLIGSIVKVDVRDQKPCRRRCWPSYWVLWFIFRPIAFSFVIACETQKKKMRTSFDGSLEVCQDAAAASTHKPFNLFYLLSKEIASSCTTGTGIAYRWSTAPLVCTSSHLSGRVFCPMPESTYIGQPITCRPLSCVLVLIVTVPPYALQTSVSRSGCGEEACDRGKTSKRKKTMRCRFRDALGNCASSGSKETNHVI
jgi:hypothetical protein